MTRRTLTFTATRVDASHKHIEPAHYFRQYEPQSELQSVHSMMPPEFDHYRIPGEGAPACDVEVTVHDVDVTDFLDAAMVVDEIDHRDLLNAMDAGDVADWLRGEGYQVEEDE